MFLCQICPISLNEMATTAKNRKRSTILHASYIAQMIPDIVLNNSASRAKHSGERFSATMALLLLFLCCIFHFRVFSQILVVR